MKDSDKGDSYDKIIGNFGNGGYLSYCGLKSPHTELVLYVPENVRGLIIRSEDQDGFNPHCQGE